MERRRWFLPGGRPIAIALPGTPRGCGDGADNALRPPVTRPGADAVVRTTASWASANRRSRRSSARAAEHAEPGGSDLCVAPRRSESGSARERGQERRAARPRAPAPRSPPRGGPHRHERRAANTGNRRPAWAARSAHAFRNEDGPRPVERYARADETCSATSPGSPSGDPSGNHSGEDDATLIDPRGRSVNARVSRSVAVRAR